MKNLKFKNRLATIVVITHSIGIVYFLKFKFGEMIPQESWPSLDNSRIDLLDLKEMRKMFHILEITIQKGQNFNAFLVTKIGNIGLAWSISLLVVAGIFFQLGKNATAVVKMDTKDDNFNKY